MSLFERIMAYFISKITQQNTHTLTEQKNQHSPATKLDQTKEKNAPSLNFLSVSGSNWYIVTQQHVIFPNSLLELNTKKSSFVEIFMRQ